MGQLENGAYKALDLDMHISNLVSDSDSDSDSDGDFNFQLDDDWLGVDDGDDVGRDQEWGGIRIDETRSVSSIHFPSYYFIR